MCLILAPGDPSRVAWRAQSRGPAAGGERGAAGPGLACRPSPSPWGSAPSFSHPNQPLALFRAGKEYFGKRWGIPAGLHPGADTNRALPPPQILHNSGCCSMCFAAFWFLFPEPWMWNASLGSQGIGTGVTTVLFPTPGVGVEGMTNMPKGNISPGAFLLQDSSGTNGTCSATGKGTSQRDLRGI